MEIKKLYMAMLAATTVGLTACGGSSSSGGNSADSDTTCSVGVGTESSDVYFANGATTGTPVCDLSGVISEDVTLTTDYVYRLNSYVYVGNGNTELASYSDVDSYTLTVEAGVQFRSTGLGSLVITRGSEIDIQGTAAAPVVMAAYEVGTSASSAESFETVGGWGGLVLQGMAKNNQCEVEYTNSAVCNTADEAGTGYHGGEDDSDSSGSISYLIVAEGGYEVAPDSEVNGITVHSVGYNTEMSNIMVYRNADDGVEFFGGAANVKNLILVDNGDESIDWDDGYRGNIQFALVRQGVAEAGDNGIEADNAGLSNTAEPISNPTLTNLTFQVGAEGSAYFMRAKLGTQGTLSKVAADNYINAFRVEDTETDITIENSMIEFSGLATKDTSHDTNMTGWSSSSVSTAVTLGDAFQVTESGADLGSATTATSANGSAGFFTATDYVGAVDPAVTTASAAWWSWAADVVPAAFE